MKKSIIISIATISALFLFSCGTENQSELERFAQFAKVRVAGKASFNGENTLTWTPIEKISPLMCSFVFLSMAADTVPLNPPPYVKPVCNTPYDHRDSSLAARIYVTKRANTFYSLSNDLPFDVSASGINKEIKDTILGEIYLEGQDVIQVHTAGAEPELEKFGDGFANVVLVDHFVGGYRDVLGNMTGYKVDTLGYIPNRLTARFKVIANKLFKEGKYDECREVMNKMLKFIPLDCGAQYRELIATGREIHIKDTAEMHRYFEIVKQEDGL